METQSSTQPRQDELINIPLTLEYIFSLAGEFTSKKTSLKSEIFGDERTNCVYKIARNIITKNECKMTCNGCNLPYDKYLDDFYYYTQIIVEIKSGKSYITCVFDATNASTDEINKLENEALKTFESWSILIGAKQVDQVLI